jgi:hypothetical protein
MIGGALAREVRTIFHISFFISHFPLETKPPNRQEGKANCRSSFVSETKFEALSQSSVYFPMANEK